MKVLVTGGAGFIGRSLVDDLLANGIEVRVLDKAEGALATIDNPALEIAEGSTEDPETVHQAVEGVTVIYHLAETFSSRPREILDIDIQGNINLLEAAAKNGIEHFLFASTHRVYGKPRYLPVDEEHPLHPEESGRALHAIFKLANEKLCLTYWQEHRLPVTIFRFWWSFSQDIGGKALRTLIDTALAEEPIIIPEKAGGNFLHNDDATAAFRLATLNDAAYGQTFNLSSGTFTTWQELAKTVCRLTGSSSRIELVPQDEWQNNSLISIDRSITYECDLDISKIRRLIGYKPGYSPSEVADRLTEAVTRLVLTRKKK
ncbi:MAG: NAD-dependent epimerase/dehydratase family protein [Dehalococcoidales bacterium]|nr:NAD-dependent epimerase/dehydratase family protein [Dehalococcoidales bacterium]